MAADGPPPLPSFAFEAVESILAASSGQPEESPTAKSERQETTSGRQDGISCALCEQPKRNGAYCPSHKRAYDTIYRAAMQPEARKQPAEDAVWDAALLTWKKTSHWFCLNIFGDDKQRKSGKYKQPQLVARLLCQFVIDHPEGKEKRKVRRNAVNLYQLFSAFGARQSSDEVTGLKKVDEEIFTGMMKMYRNWSDARCLEFWNEYKSDPDVKRDEQGPRHSKLRLHLPYSLFGEDRQEDKKGIYEDRSLQRSNKASKMSEDEVHGFRSEVARGFKRPFSNTEAVATMHGALGASSVTLEDGEGPAVMSSLDLLQMHGKSCMPDCDEKNMNDTDASNPSKKGRTDTVCSSPSDVKDARSSAHRRQSAELSKLRSGLLTTLKDALVVLGSGDAAEDNDLMSTLDERIIIGCACLKCNLKMSAGSDGSKKVEEEPAEFPEPDVVIEADKQFKFKYTTAGNAVDASVVSRALQTAKAAGGEIAAALLHTEALRAILSTVALLPIESPSTLESWSALEAAVLKTKDASGAPELDSAAALFEHQQVLMDQLKSAVAASTTSLKKVVGDRAKLKRKIEEKAKTDADKARKERLHEAAVKAKQELQFHLMVRGFHLNFTELGHESLRLIDNDDDFKKLKAGVTIKIMHKPFKLGKECKGIKDLLLEAGMSNVLKCWNDPETGDGGAGFLKVAKARGGSAFQHGMTVGQGCLLVQDRIGEYFDRITSLPTQPLQEAASQAQLFGYTDSHVRHWWEPNLLGSFRIVSSGTLLLYLVDGGVLNETLKKDPEILNTLGKDVASGLSDKSPSEKVSQVMKAMNKECAEQLLAVDPACKISHGSVTAGESVYIPPGWFVSASPGNGDRVAGIRGNFMVKSDTSPLTFCKEFGEGDIIKQAETLLNVMTTCD